MAAGRLRARRIELVAQAALVWTSATAEQLTKFIETGQMPESDENNQAGVFPYDAGALKQIVGGR